MLERGEPAAGDGFGELAVGLVLYVEVVGFRAVEDRGSFEGIGLDVEIRT